MTSTSRRLAKMVQLAALLSDQALVPVAKAQALVIARQRDVQAKAEARQLLCRDANNLTQAALIARQIETLRHQHAAALSALALSQAELDHVKDQARLAFGRKVALSRLLRASSRKG